MSKSRNWCFTAWVEFEWEKLIDKKCTYIIVGREVCPDTKKIHWQGYAEFSYAVSLGAMKKHFDDKTHFEQRRGTQEQAIDYCKKEGDWEEFGKFQEKNPGKRTDLVKAVDMIDCGMTDKEIIRSGNVSLQAAKSLDYLRLKMVDERTEKPKVFWLYGETGTGKSHKAHELCEGFYDKVSFYKDFIIGYTGRDSVVFQEFRGQMPLSLVLQLTDKWPCTINIKGGSAEWNPNLIVFTSPYKPEVVYKNCKENIKQLLRRIDEVICLDPEVRSTEVEEGNTEPPLRGRYALDSDESEDEEI